MNLPAIFIIFLISLLLIKGTAESAIVNNIIVVIKVGIVLLIIGAGWHFINPANHTPYLIPMAQTRVFYAMSIDGLVPAVFSKLHTKFRTPYISQLLFFIFVSLFAGFVPDSVVGDMVSIGTLFAFVLVCIGIFILRRKSPEIGRPFKTPLYWLVCPLGAIICGLLIASEGLENWLRLIGWLLIGLFVYFGYSWKHSKIRSKR